MDRLVLGIDLGTTNSVAAVADGGQVQVISHGDDQHLIPSVVSFHPNGTVLVGEEARERRLIDAEHTVYSVKRLIGRPFLSEEVRHAQERFAFELVQSSSGGVVVKVREDTYTLTEISALVLREIRRFFDERSFLEVDTPPMVPSPGLDLHLEAFAIADAEPARYLATSPEYQMKRLLAGGLPRIYQLGSAFRRGEQGRHHEPSFRMLEWYRAFDGSAELMSDTEELVAAVARALHEGSMVVDVDGTSVNLKPPWERLTLEQAFSRYAGVSAEALSSDEDAFFRVLVEQVEPQLGRVRPVFLTGYPASMASLARLDPTNAAVADRFEAYVAGVELCNGFGELIDPVEQRERLIRDQSARRAQGLPVYPIDERFLGALEEGMPPAGGNALGVDRLVMLLLGADDIADVVAIPDALL